MFIINKKNQEVYKCVTTHLFLFFILPHVIIHYQITIHFFIAKFQLKRKKILQFKICPKLY